MYRLVGVVPQSGIARLEGARTVRSSRRRPFMLWKRRVVPRSYPQKWPDIHKNKIVIHRIMLRINNRRYRCS